MGRLVKSVREHATVVLRRNGEDFPVAVCFDYDYEPASREEPGSLTLDIVETYADDDAQKPVVLTPEEREYVLGYCEEVVSTDLWDDDE